MPRPSTHPTHRRSPFLIAALVTLTATALTGPGTATAQNPDRSRFNFPLQPRKSLPPSVILVELNAVGFSHLDAYGPAPHASPNIRRLAEEGTRFSNYCAGAASDALARSVLFSGRFAPPSPERNAAGNTPPRLARELVARRYVTAAMGRFTLADNDTPVTPLRLGFDEWLGFLSEDHASEDRTDWLWRNDRKFHPNRTTPDAAPPHAIDLITVAARNFIRIQNPKPFFLYLPLPWPRSAPAGPDSPDADTQGAAFGEDLDRVDHLVGTILDALDQYKIAEHTLVILTSNHGPGSDAADLARPTHPDDLSNRVLRVPLILRRPGVIPGGRSEDAPWGAWDLLPTLVDAARGTIPEQVDGHSRVPLWLHLEPSDEHPAPPEPWFCWNSENASAARLGRWKAVRSAEGRWSLFDLDSDPGEQNPLANPAVLDQIQARLMERFPEEQHTESDSSPERPQ